MVRASATHRVSVQDGPVLTQAFQLFAGQNQRFEWEKNNYDLDAGENGGVSGVVYYGVTRAEDDPRFAAVEDWEPGIPRVQVNLYRDLICNSNGGPAISPLCPESISGEIGDGIPDEVNGDPGVQLADVDNHPIGWSEGETKGLEDVDRNGNGIFDLGDAIRFTHTDSWDDSLPVNCELGDGTEVIAHGVSVPIEQCADGLRTWNQARPGVFDGGYAFGPGDPLAADPLDRPLPTGTYIVEAATPPGYKLVKEEDRNVDFGPTPIPAILPPRCVGDERQVPQLFSFMTADGSGDPSQAIAGVDVTDPDNWAPFAGVSRSLCDRKRVDLSGTQNSAADFFMFTDVPKAARGVGLVTDDLANEAGQDTVGFTEKYSPPWIPIAVFDYSGREIFRTYSDEFGAYNYLAPSTYAINLPTPSGVGPKMLQKCMNHPGPIADPDNPTEFITDPWYRPQYDTTCYNFNFETGRVTYLDTPVIRMAAFVGPLQSTLDCEPQDLTPVIKSVINTTTSEPAVLRAGETLQITSMGLTDVRNPDFPGGTLGDPADPPLVDEFVNRNFGFGTTPGTVSIGALHVSAGRCHLGQRSDRYNGTHHHRHHDRSADRHPARWRQHRGRPDRDGQPGSVDHSSRTGYLLHHPGGHRRGGPR